MRRALCIWCCPFAITFVLFTFSLFRYSAMYPRNLGCIAPSKNASLRLLILLSRINGDVPDRKKLFVGVRGSRARLAVGNRSGSLELEHTERIFRWADR